MPGGIIMIQKPDATGHGQKYYWAQDTELLTIAGWN